MAATPVVEHLDILEQIGDCVLACRVACAVDPFVLQAVEEAFGRRVDAPMSSTGRGLAQVGQDQRIQLPYQVTLQTPMDFLGG